MTTVKRRRSFRIGQVSPMRPVRVLERPSVPFVPVCDTEQTDNQSGDAEQGLFRSSSAEREIAKVIVAHPEHPNCILHGLRRDNHKWSIPGGHLDPGETPYEGMCREFEEECGLAHTDFDYLQTQEIPEKGLKIHLFEAPSLDHKVWDSLDNSKDPDSEYLCFTFLDPRTTDFDLHVPREHCSAASYLDSIGREAYVNDLLDLTTERQAALRFAGLLVQRRQPSGRVAQALVSVDRARVLRWFAPTVRRVANQRRDVAHFYLRRAIGQNLRLNEATVDAISKSYDWQSENVAEDPDLKLGSAPYDSGGQSPADDMLEDTQDVAIVQYANLVVESATMGEALGVGFRDVNDKAMPELDEDVAVQRNEWNKV